jgi:hypothetical protein
VFLPADVKIIESGSAPALDRAVSGKDFTTWALPIVDKGAFLWTIYDACHGGFGSDSEWPAGAVFLYASTPTQDTGENDYPDVLADLGDNGKGQEEAKGSRCHGIFTHTLYEILKQETDLTYVELVKRIQTQYQTQVFGMKDTPWLVGKNRHQTILGPAQRERFSRLQVYAHAQGDLRLNAGSLHGLTAGMILAVHGLDDEGEKSSTVGHIQVTEIKDDSARVRPCEYRDIPMTKDLPALNRCEPVYIEYRDNRLRVGLAARAYDGVAMKGDEYRRWADRLQPLVKSAAPLVRWVADAAGADLLLQPATPDSGTVYLVGSTPYLVGQSRTRGVEYLQDQGPAIYFGPVVADKLRTALNRVARAQNLLSLAERLESEQGSSTTSLNVELKMVRYRDDADRTGEAEWRDRAISLNTGDSVAFRIENHSAIPVDVTLLRINGDSTITLFPVETAELSAGQSLTTRSIVAIADRDFAGVEEHVVLIAVPHQRPATTFGVLAEPDLDPARKEFKAALDTPLGQLFQYALYGAGNRRGLDVGTINDQSLRSVTWQTRPWKPGAGSGSR